MEHQLNLTLKPDSEFLADMTIKHLKIRYTDDGEIEMSKEEML